MAIATFFSIKPPAGEDAREWAREYWDTYGFDYDLERCGPRIFAWPLEDDEDAEDELREALDEDDIEYTTFRADIDEMFPTL